MQILPLHVILIVNKSNILDVGSHGGVPQVPFFVIILLTYFKPSFLLRFNASSEVGWTAEFLSTRALPPGMA